MQLRGIFGHLTPFHKLLLFCLLSLGSMALFMTLGWLVASPLWKDSLPGMIFQLNGTPGSDTVDALKFFQIMNQLGLFIFPSLVFAILDGGAVSGYLMTNRLSNIASFLLCILLLFVSQPLVHWLYEINQQLRFPDWLGSLERWIRQTEENATKLTALFFDTKTWKGFAVNMVMIALLPAVGEEFFFRGVIQRLMLQWTRSRHAAVLITAFLFGILHFQFLGLLPRMALGIVFGYVFFLTRTIWAPVLIHFINNGMAVVISFMAARGITRLSYLDFGNVTGAGWVIASAVLIILLFYSLSQLTNRPEK